MSTLTHDQIVSRLMVCQDLLHEAIASPADQWQLPTIGNLLDGCIDALQPQPPIIDRAMHDEIGAILDRQRQAQDEWRADAARAVEARAEWQAIRDKYEIACMSFDCTTCGAVAGKPCTNGSGRGTRPHTNRRRRADNKGAISPREAAERGLLPDWVHSQPVGS